MPLARIGQTLLYFAHIPKTGGTSIEAYLRAKGQVALYFAKPNDWMKCSPQHLHAGPARAMFRPGFCDHAFAVLRDPVARLQSEYRYRARQVARRGKTIEAFDDWVARTFNRYEANPYVFDNHIRPQTEFLWPEMTLFRLEDGMDRVFDWIDQISGDARPAQREWMKKSDDVPVGLSNQTHARIEAFYAADYALLAGQGQGA